MGRETSRVYLEISPEIAALSFAFPPDFPRDRADRIIAATARAHGLRLVTRDRFMQDPSASHYLVGGGDCPSSFD
jgi:PIN domain nuclease of toxin-antitoxin system